MHDTCCPNDKFFLIDDYAYALMTDTFEIYLEYTISSKDHQEMMAIPLMIKIDHQEYLFSSKDHQ